MKSIGTEGSDLRCSHTSVGLLTAADITNAFVAEREEKTLQPSSKMLKCSIVSLCRVLCPFFFLLSRGRLAY